LGGGRSVDRPATGLGPQFTRGADRLDVGEVGDVVLLY
jgi:hypothetical protein